MSPIQKILATAMILAITLIHSNAYEFDIDENLVHVEEIANENDHKISSEKIPPAANNGDLIHGEVKTDDTLLSRDVFINTDKRYKQYKFYVRSTVWNITEFFAINIGREIGIVDSYILASDSHSSNLTLTINIPTKQNTNELNEVRIWIETHGSKLKGGSAGLKVSGLLLTLSSLLYFLMKP